jgi:signal transduction histidine kinase
MESFKPGKVMGTRSVTEGIRFGILPKMIVSFLFVSIIPLALLGYLASENLDKVGFEAVHSAESIGQGSLQAAEDLGAMAIQDSVQALDAKSTEAIELRTVELAHRIADFLYERDKDILHLASVRPTPSWYLQIYESARRDVILPSSPQGQEHTVSPSETDCDRGGNAGDRTSWRHNPPCAFNRVSRPLYREITFVDLEGQERIKIAEGRISNDLKNIREKTNTYCKAEDYFPQLGRLKEGEVYVSRVIGPYVEGWLARTDEGVKVTPESAYAGRENPHGRRFEGIIRWATPVFSENGRKLGYVTAALDHTHVMEFTDHVVPTEERFTEHSDGGSGNYAFLWDDQDRCISHARDFFICGYDPDTGEQVPGWLSQEVYDAYRASGLALAEFVAGRPAFEDFRIEKDGSKEQMAAGRIPLDCRVLDMAPQCEGWHRGTEDGGSGSFLIFWSGLWKLTTYAAVPYHTGIYGATKRGFGYVTIGANVDDFHKAASITRAYIEKGISDQSLNIQESIDKAKESIGDNARRNRGMILTITLIAAALIIGVSIVISYTITRPLRHLTDVALAMSQGHLDQNIQISSSDETGRLASAFNRMASAVAEVDRMKSEFVTTASHELRTPVHSMLLGISGILGGYAGPLSDEVRQDLQVVEEGIERLIRLVDNLLDLSRMESRKMELFLTDVSIEEIIDTALTEMTDLLAMHGHQLRREVAPRMPALKGDHDRLVQVVVNLLSNSAKYTPRLGRIVVGAEERDGRLILSVADNGYGIPKWAQQRVFERFFQADQIMAHKMGGSGLGLTISKWIVEQHGGAISCESPLSDSRYPDFPVGGERKGTVFFVELPLNREP